METNDDPPAELKQRLATDLGRSREALEAADAEAARLRGENDKLRDALKPFADLADGFSADKWDDGDDACGGLGHVTVGEFRAAAAAMKSADLAIGAAFRSESTAARVLGEAVRNARGEFGQTVPVRGAEGGSGK